MKDQIKNSWRGKHARALFRDCLLIAIALTGNLIAEIFLFQEIWLSAGLAIILMFIAKANWRLYVQYKKLPNGSKYEMVRTIRNLESNLPYAMVGIVLLSILNLFRYIG